MLFIGAGLRGSGADITNPEECEASALLTLQEGQC